MNSNTNSNQKDTQNAVSNQNQQSASAIAVTSNESLKIIAETIGVNNLSDEACRELASDLSFTIKSLIIDAQKFSRRSRRKKLITSDIDYALKARSIEPIYGFSSNDPIPFRCTTSTGGNGGGRSIYYVDDQVVDLNEIIVLNNQTVKIPNDFVINAHWLAIEGVQPAVPENPQLISREQQKKEAIDVLNNNKSKERAQQRNVGENLVKLKTLIPHDLSMEQQIYFKEITEACVGSDENKRTEALNSLAIDPGLHQLLPRFILFISEGVRLNIIQFNMAILIYLMRMAKSLIENKSIYLEKYLHELLPSITSCLLSKQLCARPDIDNHYALREFCARLIGQIVKAYGSTLTTLKTRVVKVFLNSLQSEKTTFSTLFGAICGLAELGDDVCETFIFPLVKMLGERIIQILDGTGSSQEKLPAERVKQELIKIITDCLKTKPPKSSDEFDYLTTEFGAYFGQLIHAQLMKIRNQHISAVQAQTAATASVATNRTIISSQNLASRQNSFQSQASSNAFMPSRSISTVSQISKTQSSASTLPASPQPLLKGISDTPPSSGVSVITTTHSESLNESNENTSKKVTLITSNDSPAINSNSVAVNSPASNTTENIKDLRADNKDNQEPKTSPPPIIESDTTNTIEEVQSSEIAENKTESKMDQNDDKNIINNNDLYGDLSSPINDNDIKNDQTMTIPMDQNEKPSNNNSNRLSDASSIDFSSNLNNENSNQELADVNKTNENVPAKINESVISKSSTDQSEDWF